MVDVKFFLIDMFMFNNRVLDKIVNIFKFKWMSNRNKMGGCNNGFIKLKIWYKVKSIIFYF